MSMPVVPPALWIVDKSKYESQFYESDTDFDGFVSGGEVKGILVASGVAQNYLAHIWALVDINKNGKLNVEQFALAMHLIELKREHNQEPPRTLPPDLIPPSFRQSPAGMTDTSTSTQDEHGISMPAVSSWNKEIDDLTMEMQALRNERRTVDSFVIQLEADMTVKQSEIKNLEQTSEVKEPPRKHTDNSVSSVISHFNQLQMGKVKVESGPFTKQKAAQGDSRPSENHLQRAVDNKKNESVSPIKTATKEQPKLQWFPVNYEKEDKLGSGQFGVVYKCWDKERRRYFVAKHTIIQIDQNMEVAVNEVKRLKDLSHHRIIEYYGCKSEENAMVIFMEYMPLGSIRQLIDKHGAIGEQTAIIYTGQILEGLAYVHDKGIVHSDLKCDNLLSDHNGNVKIGDFGIAVQRILKADKSYINPKSAGMGGGTMLWMAPEVFATERVSRTSDMWSLGITIVEMLTAKAPYSDMKPFEFMGALFHKTLTYNVNELLVTKIGEPLILLVTKMLQVDPSKRLKTGNEGAEMFGELGLLG